MIRRRVADGAHADLIATSPESGAIVGATVDTVRLTFSQDITNVVRARVETRGGAVPAVTVSQPAPNVVLIALDEPVTTEGVYIVRYLVVSADGDPNDFGYGFGCDSAAAPAASGEATGTDGDALRISTVIALTATVPVVGLVLWIGRRPRKWPPSPAPLENSEIYMARP